MDREARVPSLDGIRGLAITLVLICHFIAQKYWPVDSKLFNHAWKLLSLTWCGVDLFFVLSGFLITGILLSKKGATNYFRVFYARRFCRIVPLYALVILLPMTLMICLRLPVADEWLKGEPIWSFYLFLQNIFEARSGTVENLWAAPTWSLAVEEQFYLVLPLLVLLCNRRSLLLISLCVVLGTPIVRSLIYSRIPYSGCSIYVSFPTRADALFMGVLLALAFGNEPTAEFIRSHRRDLRAAFAAAAALLVCMALCLDDWAWLAKLHGLYTMTALTGALLITLTLTGGWLQSLMELRPLQFMGRISYGAYLLHCPLLLIVGKATGVRPTLSTGQGALVILLAASLTIIVSAALWRAVESRFIAFGHRIAYQRAEPPRFSVTGARFAQGELVQLTPNSHDTNIKR